MNLFTKYLYSRTFIYSILLLLSNSTLAFASEPSSPPPLINYTGKIRTLSINIETLDPKEPTTEQLYHEAEKDLKDHPEYNNENHFVLGYILQLLDDDVAAHQHFNSIEKNSTLYATTLYFDGISLRKIGLKSPIPNEQKQNCKRSIDAFNKVQEIAPTYFRIKQPKELLLSTFCYFDALTQKGRLDPQNEQWFKNTLQNVPSSQTNNIQVEKLFFQYLDAIKTKVSKEQLQAYLEFGFTILPKSEKLLDEAAQIKMTLPKIETTTTVVTRKSEPEAETLLQRGKNLKQKNDLSGALQAWIDLIIKYPGSYTGEDAKNEITEMIKKEVREKRPTETFTEDLKKLPPEMIFSLAKYLWNQDYDLPAYKLYQYLTEKYPFFEKTAESYYSLARMHEDWSEWTKAIEFYSILVEKHSRSIYFERAHFKIGFLSYMNKDYAKALEWLSKEKELVQSPHQKAQAIYWLARTYEKLEQKEKADTQLEEIRKKYPLTYYSFILGIDPEKITKHDQLSTKFEIQKGDPLYLPVSFLSVGLHRPARQMIQDYGNQSDEHLLQIIELLNDSGFYSFSMPNALDLAERTIEQSGLQENLVKMIFPVKYLDIIEQESKSAQTDPVMILSLIKQESGYSERAVSESNAFGLMQLLMTTAQNVAKKNLQPSPQKIDLFNPKSNIKLGTLYFSNLNEQFSNDIVLALSAYNAGPERAIKWKNRWTNVRKDEFVELIPFPETRKYVKLILRNYSFYKFLVQNKNASSTAFGF